MWNSPAAISFISRLPALMDMFSHMKRVVQTSATCQVELSTLLRSIERNMEQKGREVKGIPELEQHIYEIVNHYQYVLLLLIFFFFF